MNTPITSTAIPARAMKAHALANMTASFECFCLASGMEALAEMMESDAEAACGPRHARDKTRKAHRWGKAKGRIGFHGGKVEIERPRLRSFDGKELALASWEAAQSEDWLGKWAMKFGPDYARRLKRKKPGRQDIWHLDEVVITINGEKRYLWRAVDQDGYVLDEIVQIRRNTRAAKRLLERLLRKQGCPPKRMITDKLGSYGAARRQIMPKVEHRQHKGLNNRAENSHVPIRKRERAMQGFRSWSGLQRFVETFSAVRNHFVPPHSHRSAIATHLHRLTAMEEWKSVTLAAA